MLGKDVTMEQKIERLLKLITEYDKMKKVYLSCYETLSIIRDELRAGKYQLTDMVNFIYVMRELSKFADDLRKEADGIMHMFENMTCAVYTTQNTLGPIRASLATGTPDLKLGVKIPNQRRDPEKFQKMMAYFGVSDSAVADRLVKPYWPGICEHVSILAEEGKPLPPGIDPENTYPTYKVRIKMIANLDEVMNQINKILKETDGKEVEACNELLTTRPTKN